MLWNLESGWLLMAIAAVAFVSFMVALLLDAIMGPDGFGPVGNAIVVTAGFFATIALINMAGTRLTDLRLAAAYGIAGAFCFMSMMAGLKAIAVRLRL